MPGLLNGQSQAPRGPPQVFEPDQLEAALLRAFQRALEPLQPALATCDSESAPPLLLACVASSCSAPLALVHCAPGKSSVSAIFV